ncbi:MAG TPA: hypothetical protein VGR08_05835 [Thermomicrobiales bacterium]|nr:hypothetical protein [Thermomicrobiales bacterium]
MKRDGDPLPVVHSVFAADALVQVLQERYDIAQVGDCALERSYVNDVFRLTTAAGALYYLKVYRRDWRSLADVAWELRLQEHLLTSAVSIARPIPRRNGSRMTVLDAPEGER